jgi:hypothetical protein
MEHDTMLSGKNLQEIHKNTMPSYLGYTSISVPKMVEALNFSVTSVNSIVLILNLVTACFFKKFDKLLQEYMMSSQKRVFLISMIIKGKVHPITGHQGPRGGVEL